MAARAVEVAKRGLARFGRQVPNYRISDGALAALPLLLLWIYVSWMITLIGALVDAALPVVKYERWWYQPVPGGAFRPEPRHTTRPRLRRCASSPPTSNRLNSPANSAADA